MTVINIQQPLQAPVNINNGISTILRPTMPVWLGAYLGFGFVF